MLFLPKGTSEPCLYIYRYQKVSALLLVYVDDVICGTNSEARKVSIFAKLDDKYGIKKQERLHIYLGVQVHLLPRSEQSRGYRVGL